jgi:hypothetical protein
VEAKKIILDNEVIAYSYEFIPKYSKEDIINSISDLTSTMPHIKTDGYIFNQLKEEFKDVYGFCSDVCVKLSRENLIHYDNFKLHKWISILRSNPVQPMELDVENKEPTYHNHKEIAERSGNTPPTYSFVYYVQMPDNLSGIDGNILFKNKHNSVLKYLPKQNEVLVFKSSLPHAPIHAKDSTKNRIVLAGDFIIERGNKSNKTLI